MGLFVCHWHNWHSWHNNANRFSISRDSRSLCNILRQIISPMSSVLPDTHPEHLTIPNATTLCLTESQIRANKNKTVYSHLAMPSSTMIPSRHPQPGYTQPTSSYRERSLVIAIQRQRIRRQSYSPATFIDARQNTTTSQRKQVREFESNGFQLKISARTSRRPAWNSSTNLDSKRRAPNTPAQPVKIAVPLLPASTNQERVNPVRASQPSTQHVPTIHPISSSPSPAYALNSGSPMPALTIGPLTPLPSIPHLLRTLEPNSQSKFAIYEPLYEYAKEAPSDAEVARMKNQLCKGRPSDCKCGTGICVSDVLEMVKANPKINNFGSNLLDDIMTITFQSRSLRAPAISACLQD
ncbi:hypothetical protein AG1IA_05715 [Rhizoctonia solani AG-1 IA]|uniref:Uncharacterized protein n=1 Tax=Thanatephorus cucumeris (strain AG1-IA) TaxID=983506 RepID=L8WU03_THACA|nr:hypothetical protein AG1IA_05715 [Rhizoctonia solani AG-1 IA]